jgi:hypothetical protein
VVEDDRGILDGVTGFAVEAVLQVDKVLGDSDSYRKNLVGKLGFGSEDDQNVFSLSVIQGMCGAQKTSFAFFMADGSGDSLSCKNAVVSKNALEFGKRYYLMSTWNGKKVSLYENGKKVGNIKEGSVIKVIRKSKTTQEFVAYRLVIGGGEYKDRFAEKMNKWKAEGYDEGSS